MLDDSYGVWFDANRSMKTEGRAAARRHKNPIHLIPSTKDSSNGSYGRYAFSEVCVVRTASGGASIPLHRANLARGPQQLLVIPDESGMDVESVDWHQLGKVVSFVHLDLPTQEYVYHYRLVATIVLAEAARQIGQKAGVATSRRTRGEPFYDSALTILAEMTGETVYLEDLEAY